MPQDSRDVQLESLHAPRDFFCELASPLKHEIQDSKLSQRAQMSLIMVLSSPPGPVTSNELQLTSRMDYPWRSVSTQGKETARCEFTL